LDGYLYARAGRRDAATDLLRKMEDASNGFVSAYNVAMVHAGLDEPAKVFEWLEKAFVDRSGGITWLKVDPRLKRLREDPRLKDLMRRVGLPTS